MSLRDPSWDPNSVRHLRQPGLDVSIWLGNIVSSVTNAITTADETQLYNAIDERDNNDLNVISTCAAGTGRSVGR